MFIEPLAGLTSATPTLSHLLARPQSHSGSRNGQSYPSGGRLTDGHLRPLPARVNPPTLLALRPTASMGGNKASNSNGSRLPVPETDSVDC